MRCDAFFTRLGDAIRDEWARLNFDQRRLPDLAARHLRETPPSAAVTADDLVEFALFARDRVVTEAHRSFGQPNLTVYSDPRFFIEALFWLDGTTAIHAHGFSGAFHVLAGGSVHSEFSFDETARLNDGLRLGRVRQTSIELLRQGDVRPIHPGARTIHSLFHLDHPSVSIVVRTPHDAEAGIQFAYLYPGVAYDPFARGQAQTLSARTIEMLRKSQHADYQATLVRYLQTCEAREAVELLLAEATAHDEAWLARVLGQLGDTPYASALPDLERSLRDSVWRSNLQLLRGKVTERELRLTLGLLLASRDRASLYALLAAAFPDAPPQDSLVESLRRLAAAGIGFPDDDSSIELVVPLLDGMSDDEVVAHLTATFGAAEVDANHAAIREACHLLRRHPLLAGVLPPR